MSKFIVHLQIPNQSIQLAIFIALFLSIFCNTKAWAVNVGSDTTLNADTSVQQNINAANVTLTNNAVIELSNTDPTVRIRSNGVTVPITLGQVLYNRRVAIGR